MGANVNKLNVSPCCIIKLYDSLGRVKFATAEKRPVLPLHVRFLSRVNTVEVNLPDFLGN
jgi:hypothetical protein